MYKRQLQKAYEKVMNLSDAEYFELLTNLLKTYVQSGDGEIYFSEKDKQRIPASFVEETEKIVASKGGKLTFASETKQIDGGFILVYGGIEENCTIPVSYTHLDVYKRQQEVFCFSQIKAKS